jgi:bifunctional non-homologous end joining protein LigD
MTGVRGGHACEDVTPGFGGATGSTGRGTVGRVPRFVIHEHHASTRHFDLRLEREDTLWSWALPKGPPTDTAHDRLAIRVDDHDLDHLGFEDLTPVDGAEPGAVTKSIWDRGTYETARATDDKLVIDVDGERMAGRFALIHTGDDQWLMHLMTITTPGGSS